MTKRPESRTTFARAVALPLLVSGAAIAAAELGRRAYRETRVFEPSPDPVISWDPVDYGIPAGATEELWIDTPDGERLHAWYCRSAAPIASALFCHGNTGNITVSAHTIPHLLQAGLSILFFDYRGFGRSSGKTSIAGAMADGVTAARFHERLRPAELPSVLYGYSLGGAIGAQVINRHPFDGLVLQSTFTSLSHLTRLLYPRFPLHLLAGKLFDTIDVVRRLRVPLLVLHGTDDEVIPKSMAQALFEACRTDRRIHCIQGAQHRDVYIRDAESVTRHIAEFLARLSEEPRASGPAVAPAEPWMRNAVRALRRFGSSRMTRD